MRNRRRAEPSLTRSTRVSSRGRNTGSSSPVGYSTASTSDSSTMKSVGNEPYGLPVPTVAAVMRTRGRSSEYFFNACRTASSWSVAVKRESLPSLRSAPAAVCA